MSLIAITNRTCLAFHRGGRSVPVLRPAALAHHRGGDDVQFGVGDIECAEA